MRSSYIKKLENIVEDLSIFLKNDYSSRFKDLSAKEDRQLFFLANILTKLKMISVEIKNEEKVLLFPKLMEGNQPDQDKKEEQLLY